MEDSASNSGKEDGAAAPRLDAPADLHMRFDCQTIGEFLTRYADDVSRGGIFVRTRELLAVGCSVNLNLQLGNGVTLLDGSGTVFWTRGADSADGEPGMGIRFGKITRQSQEMLTFLLAEKAKRAREDDGTNEFDDVRTVVSPKIEPDPTDAEDDDAAAEFHRARTVVTPVPKSQPLPSAAASTPTTPPPAENTSETERRERVPTFIPAGKSKKRLAIGLALGGLLMLSACLGVLSWGSSRPTPSKATLAAPPQPAPTPHDEPGTNRP